MFKTRLPFDYARCFNEVCPLKISCLRYLDRMNGRAIQDFKAENCKNYIKNFKDYKPQGGQTNSTPQAVELADALLNKLDNQND